MWMKLWNKLVCATRGHNYPCSIFTTSALCFCQRCGTEIAGRSFNDLEPIADEDRDLLDTPDFD